MILERLKRWLRWRSDAELDEELAAHFDAEVEANLERGLEPQEARNAARRKLGNSTRVKERSREGNPLFGLEMLLKDIRYALRNLARNPGFTLAAVLSLALGIGANTAVFSFADSILLRPLDVERPSEVVSVTAATPQTRFVPLAYRDFLAYREQNRSLEGLVAQVNVSVSLRTRPDGLARATAGQLVSGDFFSVLGARVRMGRGFQPGDDARGSPIVAVLSHTGWVNRFQSDPGVVGTQVLINGLPVTVAGVLDEEFTGTQLIDRPEIYLPLGAAEPMFPSYTPPLLDPLRGPFLTVLGRLRPGVSVETAQADLATIASALQQEYPETNRDSGIMVLKELAGRLQQETELATMLFVLLAIVGLVLLLACTNVANLLLGRASVRAREIAIRMSVGAGRGRLIGQLLTESLVLGGIGGGLGLWLGLWAIRFFASIRLPTDMPVEVAARLDTRVLLYTLAAMGVSVLLCGLWPAWRATSGDLVSPAKPAQPASGKRGARKLLVGVQTALSAVLLVAAALFVQSFQAFASQGPGFRVDNLLLATFDPASAGYSETQIHRFYADLQARVQALPGVRDAALANHIPLGWSSYRTLVARAEDPVSESATFSNAFYNRVTPEYFDAMDIVVLRGRALAATDTGEAPAVAVINERLARRLWPHSEALGQRIRLGRGDALVAEVVGIARDSKVEEVTETPASYIYLPYAQGRPFRMSLLIHTAGDPVALAGPLRAELQELGPEVPVYDLRTMREMFDGKAMLGPQLLAQIVGAMGLIALSLAAVGLYAVIAFVASRRTKEIGIRMALGASRGSVLRDVLGSGLKLTIAGIAAGLTAAGLLTRYFGGFLGTVDPRDPLTFAGAGLLLLAVAIAAGWVPAWRAAHVDPATSLREE